MKVADRVARNVIRIGGIGTIAAISTVFLFLSWVVWPLLRGESLSSPRRIAGELGGEKVLATGTDDTLSLLWAYGDSGRFVTLAAGDGQVLDELRPFPSVPTSWSFPVRTSQGVFGFADGSIRFVTIDNRTEYRDSDKIPAEDRGRPSGDRFLLDGKVAERVGVDQFALRCIAWAVTEPRLGWKLTNAPQPTGIRVGAPVIM